VQNATNILIEFGVNLHSCTREGKENEIFVLFSWNLLLLLTLKNSNS